jgi:L-amino acid N-acyltransferase YncA
VDTDVQIRPARAGDEPAIAAIYNRGIAERESTFETQPRAPEDVAAWLGDGGLPHLVAVRGDEVVGFARVTPYADRCVYSGVGEYGIYLAPHARGHGVGTRLLGALAVAAERNGLYKLTSKLFPENAASRALARRCGFREVGVHRRHGRLDGAWRDVVVVELLLGEAADRTMSPSPGGGTGQTRSA